MFGRWADSSQRLGATVKTPLVYFRTIVCVSLSLALIQQRFSGFGYFIRSGGLGEIPRVWATLNDRGGDGGSEGTHGNKEKKEQRRTGSVPSNPLRRIGLQEKKSTT